MHEQRNEKRFLPDSHFRPCSEESLKEASISFQVSSERAR